MLSVPTAVHAQTYYHNVVAYTSGTSFTEFEAYSVVDTTGHYVPPPPGCNGQAGQCVMGPLMCGKATMSVTSPTNHTTTNTNTICGGVARAEVDVTPENGTYHYQSGFVITNFTQCFAAFSGLFRIADTNFIFNGTSGSNCVYNMFCPNGNTAATCNKIVTELYIPGSGGISECKNYLHTHDLVIDGVCTYVGTADLGNAAINCN
jgi:hypothetical protein